MFSCLKLGIKYFLTTNFWYKVYRVFLNFGFLHKSLPPHRHYKKPQAGRLTGINKLPVVQAYRPTGLRQTHKLIDTQAAKLQACRHTDLNKTTILPPDRQQNYKPAATQATNYKLTATQAKDYKLATTQASHKNYKLNATQATKLQACCHTGIEQNYKLAATQV